MRVAREDLIGMWRLIRVEALTSDAATPSLPFGDDIGGALAYGDDGSVVVAWRGAHHFNAYFGTFSLDPDRGEVTHHLSGASRAEDAGGTLVRSVALNGDTLVLTQRPDQGSARGSRLASGANSRAVLRLTWKRA